MSCKLTPPPHSGISAEILGIDLTSPLRGATRRQLNADFAGHHVHPISLASPVRIEAIVGLPDDVARRLPA